MTADRPAARSVVRVADGVYAELGPNGLPQSQVDLAAVGQAGEALAWRLAAASVNGDPSTVLAEFTRFLQSSDGLQAGGAVAMAAVLELAANVLCPLVRRSELTPWPASTWLRDQAEARGVR